MSQVYYYLILSLTILIVTAIHEYIKALVSTTLGDIVPKNEKRLTLNPLKHFETLGFLLFLFFGYGWGKPVNTSSFYYKDRKKGVLITYGAPMLVNLLLAFLGSILLKVITIRNDYLLTFMNFFIQVNVATFVVNLVPVIPFSGYKILSAILKPNTALKFSQYEGVIQMVTITLLIFGFLPRILNIITSFIIGIIQ